MTSKFVMAVAGLAVLSLSVPVFAEEPTASSPRPDLTRNYEGLDEVAFYQVLQSTTASENAVLLAKNVGIVIAACPTSHFAQLAIAVGESIPVISALTRILRADVAYSIYGTRDQRAGDLDGHGSEPTYRPEGGYMFGGPLNTVIEGIAETFEPLSHPDTPSLPQYDLSRLKQSLKDGYFATRRSQEWNQVCYRAERRVQMLMGFSTRIK